MENQKLFEKYSDGNHWESHPTSYAQEFEKFLSNESLKTEALRAMVITHPAFFITDLGCGNGRDVHHFNKIGLPAIGFDNDTQVLQLAKETYPKLAAVFFHEDLEQLPFLDNTQFSHFCINVMHYVDQEKVLGEIYRTLKTGGYAFIHFNLLIIDENYSIDYHQKKSDVYELIRKFEIVEEKIFLREDPLPMPHTHHIMQVILRKN